MDLKPGDTVTLTPKKKGFNTYKDHKIIKIENGTPIVKGPHHDDIGFLWSHVYAEAWDLVPQYKYNHIYQ